MLPARKKSKGKSKKDKDEEAELEQLRKELASEKQGKEEVEWVANELEKQWVSFNDTIRWIHVSLNWQFNEKS